MIPTFLSAGVDGVEDGYYMRPSKYAHTDRHIDNLLYTELSKNDFRINAELFTPRVFDVLFVGNESFCRFDGTFTSYTKHLAGSWIFLQVKDDSVYAILIVAHDMQTSHYEIDILCRNAEIKKSKGAGEHLYMMFENSLRAIIKRGHKITIDLIDATYNSEQNTSYYTRLGFISPDYSTEDIYTTKDIAHPEETTPTSLLQLQGTYESKEEGVGLTRRTAKKKKKKSKTNKKKTR